MQFNANTGTSFLRGSSFKFLQEIMSRMKSRILGLGFKGSTMRTRAHSYYTHVSTLLNACGAPKQSSCGRCAASGLASRHVAQLDPQNSSQDVCVDPKSASTNPHIVKKVGIWMVQSVEYLVSVLAVLKAGGVFVPLDPYWPAGMLQTVLHSVKPTILLGCRHTAWASQSLAPAKIRALEAAACTVLWLPEGFVKHLQVESAHGGNGELYAGKHERFVCYVLYTSGSSGAPKGVCGTEEGLTNRLRWMEMTYPHLDSDLGCFKTTVGFIDHLTEALGPLLAGTALLIPSPDVVKGNLLALLSYIQAYKITRLTAVPSLIRALLPALQTGRHQVADSLRVLVLSGEPLPLHLWRALHSTMGHTTILNLYGSTELSGDSSYFDCTSLREASETPYQLLEQQSLISIPIGEPITDCYHFVVVDNSRLAGVDEEGELWVGGVGVAHSYLNDPDGSKKKIFEIFGEGEEVDDTSVHRQLQELMNLKSSTIEETGSCAVKAASRASGNRVFKTGDMAKTLSNGSVVVLGRKDRQVKIRGNRVAPEEIELNLEQHPQVRRVAVTPCTGLDGEASLVAYVVPEGQMTGSVSKQEPDGIDTTGVGNEDDLFLKMELKLWLAERLPQAMIPQTYVLLKTLPLTNSRKVDYNALPDPFRMQEAVSNASRGLAEQHSQGVEYIREVFARVLRVANFSSTDDFFSAGGTSISAAHVAHILAIDMRVLYANPSAIHLYNAIGDKSGMALPGPTSTQGGAKQAHVQRNGESAGGGNIPKNIPLLSKQESVGGHRGTSVPDTQISSYNPLKRKKYDDNIIWSRATSNLTPTAFLRCNRTVSLAPSRAPLQIQVADEDWSMQQRWRVSLRSCVDASPLVVSHGDVCRVFIGSHSHNFLSVDATSGDLQWEAQVGGRVESSAAVTRDASQVVVGCYDGCIYFFDFWNGQRVWSFETGGEVKCQPTLDPWTGLIWCGSHDHRIYALDSTSQTCVWQQDCGGSIFGAPAFDQGRRTVYVGTTSGVITAIKTELTMHVVWTYKGEAPIFGSLAVDPATGLVICTSVNGCVTAVSSDGVPVWQVKTDGPIFAGATISAALPSQVLVCSGDCHVYCLNLQDGMVAWKHNVGGPLTSSAHVDESLVLSRGDSAANRETNRLLCVATTSGTLHILRAPSNSITSGTSAWAATSREVAHVKLAGEVFSSPVMVGGRVFIGCRDDFLYCVDAFG